MLCQPQTRQGRGHVGLGKALCLPAAEIKKIGGERRLRETDTDFESLSEISFPSVTQLDEVFVTEARFFGPCFAALPELQRLDIWLKLEGSPAFSFVVPPQLRHVAVNGIYDSCFAAQFSNHNVLESVDADFNCLTDFNSGTEDEFIGQLKTEEAEWLASTFWSKWGPPADQHGVDTL